mmetsp:Transcript_57273/g.150015  ORF Transcript_57273/g.150015 Transcript_57273/m.150015 type:complete len:297 (+) Transcript_57273:622-1512(+)
MRRAPREARADGKLMQLMGVLVVDTQGHEFAGVSNPDGVEHALVLEDITILRCGGFGHTAFRQLVDALFIGVAVGVIKGDASPVAGIMKTVSPFSSVAGRRKRVRPQMEPTLMGAPVGDDQQFAGVMMGEELLLEHFGGPLCRKGALGQTCVRQLDDAAFIGVRRFVRENGVAGVELGGLGCDLGSLLGVTSPSKNSMRGANRDQAPGRGPEVLLRGAPGHVLFELVVGALSGVASCMEEPSGDAVSSSEHCANVKLGLVLLLIMGFPDIAIADDQRETLELNSVNTHGLLEPSQT